MVSPVAGGDDWPRCTNVGRRVGAGKKGGLFPSPAASSGASPAMFE